MKRIEKLTAEHLAIYLAYGLETLYKLSDVVNCNKDEIRSKFITLESVDFVFKYCKPILRTRQSITPEELETFSICFRMWYDKPDFDYNLMVFSDIVQMAKLHIDIFGLIESGLAVDKETIKK